MKTGKILSKYLLVVGIAVAAVCGAFGAEPGRWLGTHHGLSVVIVVIFFLSGISLERRDFAREARNWKPLLASLLSVVVFYPLLAYGVAKALALDNGNLVGFVLATSVAPALASGIVITTVAGGSAPLAIFMTIAGSLVTVFTLPLTLNLVLGIEGIAVAGERVSIPVLETIVKLLLLVVLPMVAGQLVRIPLGERASKLKGPVSLGSKLSVILIVYIATSKSTGKLEGITAGTLLLVAGVCLLVYAASLFGNVLLGKLLRFERGATKALAMVSSQKTLPIAVYVWQENFAAVFPAAAIPAIFLHVVQIVLASLIADLWARKRGHSTFRSEK